MAKITKKQLEKINEQQEALRQLVENIGALETQKHSLLHKVAEVNQEIEKFKVDLEKEYGKVTIDLQTGEIKEIEDKKEE